MAHDYHCLKSILQYIHHSKLCLQEITELKGTSATRTPSVRKSKRPHVEIEYEEDTPTRMKKKANNTDVF